MRTNTWPGPGRGRGTSISLITSGSPNCSTRIAFIVWAYCVADSFSQIQTALHLSSPDHFNFLLHPCSFILYLPLMPMLAAGVGSDTTTNVIASIIASAILLGAGFLFGKYRERRHFGKKLEDYDFYPYSVNRDNFSEFSLKDFRLGMHYFVRNFDPMAARQLIFIGEQNNVRPQLEPTEQQVYARLFARYDGKQIADD